MSVLQVQHLTKSYGGAVKALNDVSFEVPQGSVYGILGPNGSGKTTLLGIVMDVLKASSGEFSWMGKTGSNHLQRKKIGTLLETPNFYSYLSGEKNLQIAAAIKGQRYDDIPRVLQLVNLYQRKDSKFSTYSLGMKQRLAIAAALLGNPDILVFDEPTNGLDPAGIAEIRELIKQLNVEGKTIIMASHILDEVERVCTHVTIIQKGILKTSGTVGSVLSASVDNNLVIEIAAPDLSALEKQASGIPGVQRVMLDGDRLSLVCDENSDPAMINKYFFDRGIVLSRLHMKKKSLETRFLEITGNQSDR